MKQNTESGRAAARFGRENYKKVAKYISAELVPGPSNNAIWNGKKINIKSARFGVSQIGVTLNNLSWADYVVAAIQESKDCFGLYEISTTWFKGEMRDSRQDYVKMVSCDKITRGGIEIGKMPA